MHTPNPQNGLSLPYLRLTLGISALVTALYFSISFLAQGVTGAAFIAALSFCLITEITKALFAGDVAYYSAIKQNDKAVFALVIVAILFALSIMASVWFLVSNPLKEDVALTHASHKSSEIAQAITAKKAAIAACNPSYLTKCVNPRTQELTTLQNEYNKALTNEASYSDVEANRTFWKMSANAVATTPENLKMGLALVRSVLLELLGIVLIGQFTSNKRLQSHAFSQNNALRNVTDNSSAAEVFALMSAKIEQLEKELEKKP